MPNPCVHGFSRWLRDLELHRALGLLLHDDGASGDPTPEALQGVIANR
jgi:hypothetical protein